MGQLFTTPVNAWVLQHLRSLHKKGRACYKLDEYETEVPLSLFLGREDVPTCHLLMKNCTIHCRELRFDGQPLRMKSSKITFTIGKLYLRCDDLGYNVRLKGRFTFLDVLVKASFNITFERGIRVADINAETTVKKIRTQIRFDINGTNHSHLANTLLTIDNPQVASNMLNAVFLILKEYIKEGLNHNIKEVARQYLKPERNENNYQILEQ